ncbi:hypothetical protein AB4653_21705, partial [Vibrio sp. 10N.222.48.A3]
TGINAQDKIGLFVESNTNNLVKFYSQYELEKEYKFCRAPYAETIPLRKGNKGFSYGKNVDDLEVCFIDAKYQVPDYLKEHSEKAVELFKALGKIKIDDTSGEWQ